jgi:hypothetical protein
MKPWICACHWVKGEAMKTVDVTLVVLSAMSLQLAGCVQPTGSGEVERRDAAQIAKRHSFEIGPEIYYVNYQELDTWEIGGEEIEDVVEVEDTGVFYGITGAYTFRGWAPLTEEESFSGPWNWMLRAEGRYAQGQVDYDGATWGGEPLAITGIDDSVTEARLLIGPDFAVGNALTTLYAGFGYRYLNDDLSEFPGGYERESYYRYIPVGIAMGRQASEKWMLGATVEFDWLLHGLQRSHLSDVGLMDVENDQDSGYGLRASLRLQSMGRANVIIEPFVRVWCIDKSEIETFDGLAVFEPKNRTAELGIVLAVGF